MNIKKKTTNILDFGKSLISERNKRLSLGESPDIIWGDVQQRIQAQGYNPEYFFDTYNRLKQINPPKQSIDIKAKREDILRLGSSLIKERDRLLELGKRQDDIWTDVQTTLQQQGYDPNTFFDTYTQLQKIQKDIDKAREEALKLSLSPISAMVFQTRLTPKVPPSKLPPKVKERIEPSIPSIPSAVIRPSLPGEEFKIHLPQIYGTAEKPFPSTWGKAGYEVTMPEFKEAVKIPFRAGEKAIEMLPLSQEEISTLKSYAKGLLEGTSAGYVSPTEQEGEYKSVREIGKFVGYVLPIGMTFKISRGILGALGQKAIRPALKNLAAGILAGAEYGTIEKLPEGADRVENILTQSAFFGGMELGIAGIGKLLKPGVKINKEGIKEKVEQMNKPEEREKVFKSLLPKELEEAEKVKQLAKELEQPYEIKAEELTTKKKRYEPKVIVKPTLEGTHLFSREEIQQGLREAGYTNEQLAKIPFEKQVDLYTQRLEVLAKPKLLPAPTKIKGEGWEILSEKEIKERAKEVKRKEQFDKIANLKRLGFDDNQINFMGEKLQQEILEKGIPASEITIEGAPGGWRWYRWKEKPTEIKPSEEPIKVPQEIINTAKGEVEAGGGVFEEIRPSTIPNQYNVIFRDKETNNIFSIGLDDVRRDEIADMIATYHERLEIVELPPETKHITQQVKGSVGKLAPYKKGELGEDLYKRVPKDLKGKDGVTLDKAAQILGFSSDEELVSRLEQEVKIKVSKKTEKPLAIKERKLPAILEIKKEEVAKAPQVLKAKEEVPPPEDITLKETPEESKEINRILTGTADIIREGDKYRVILRDFNNKLRDMGIFNTIPEARRRVLTARNEILKELRTTKDRIITEDLKSEQVSILPSGELKVIEKPKLSEPTVTEPPILEEVEPKETPDTTLKEKGFTNEQIKKMTSTSKEIIIAEDARAEEVSILPNGNILPKIPGIKKNEWDITKQEYDKALDDFDKASKKRVYEANKIRSKEELFTTDNKIESFYLLKNRGLFFNLSQEGKRKIKYTASYQPPSYGFWVPSKSFTTENIDELINWMNNEIKKYSEKGTYYPKGFEEANHEDFIVSANQSGIKISPEVLKDYPELITEYPELIKSKKEMTQDELLQISKELRGADYFTVKPEVKPKEMPAEIEVEIKPPAKEVSAEVQDIINFYAQRAKIVPKDQFLNEVETVTTKFPDGRVYSPEKFKEVIGDKPGKFYDQVGGGTEIKKPLRKYEPKVPAGVKRSGKSIFYTPEEIEKARGDIQQRVEAGEIHKPIVNISAERQAFNNLVNNLHKLTQSEKGRIPLGRSIRIGEEEALQKEVTDEILKSLKVLELAAIRDGIEIGEYLVKRGIAKETIDKFVPLLEAEKKGIPIEIRVSKVSESRELKVKEGGEVPKPDEIIERKVPPTITKEGRVVPALEVSMKLNQWEEKRRWIEDSNVILSKLGFEVEKRTGEKEVTLKLAYIHKDLIGNKLSEQIRQLDNMKEKFIEECITQGISLKDVDDMIKGLHAPEYNKTMIERAILEGRESILNASGFFDEEATEMVTRLTEKYKDNPKFMNRVNEMLEVGEANKEFARDPHKFDPRIFSKENKLLSEEEYKNLPNWEYYAPFYRQLDEVEEIMSNRIGTERRIYKKAVGSEAEVISPIVNLLAQRKYLIERALDNEMKLTLLKAVNENPELLQPLFKVTPNPVVPVGKQVLREEIDRVFTDQLIDFAKTLGLQEFETKGMAGRVLGYYQPALKKIVRKYATSRETLSHEVGHFLDDTYRLKERFYRRGEAKGVGDEIYNFLKKYGRFSKSTMEKPAERFAEVFSWWLVHRDLAKSEVPIFNRVMEGVIEETPDLRPLLSMRPQITSSIQAMTKPIFAPQPFLSSDEFSVRINGVYNTVKTLPDIARAINNSEMFRWGSVEPVAGIFGGATRVMAQLFTKYAPMFSIYRNPIRDLQTATVNMAVERAELEGIKQGAGGGLRRAVMRQANPALLFNRARRELYNHLQGKKYSQDVDDFLTYGGKSGHFWGEDLLEAERDLYKLEAELRGENIWQSTKHITSVVDRVITDLNSAVELNPRFVFYKELVNRGIDPQRAAWSAADLTLPFHRQGEGSLPYKTFYMFFQPAIAAISKSARIIAATSKNPEVRKQIVPAIAGLVALGATVRVISKWISEEGDSKISPWRKNATLSFAINDDEGISLFPYSYEWSWLPAIGSNIVDTVWGDQTAMEGIGNIMISTLQSVSPVETEGGVIVPSLMQAPLDIALNRAWWRGKIHPDILYFEEDVKPHERYWPDTSEQAIFIAELLSKISGGKVDIYPNSIEYLANYYTGGVGQTLREVIESGGNIAKSTKGESFNKYNLVPFERSFYFPLYEKRKPRGKSQGVLPIKPMIPTPAIPGR